MPVLHSNMDPVPYLGYVENDENVLDNLEGTTDNMKVRRQISDCCEYDSENRGFVSESKLNSSKISPDEHAITPNELGSNLSQSYYKNFLNQLKDDDSELKIKTSLDKSQPKGILGEPSTSPNPTFDNYIKGGKTLNTKKTSFIKVEEFRKSKQFRESKIPTNTSFSGVDKNQIQSLGLKNYETRK